MFNLLLVKNIFEKTHDKLKDKYSYKTKLTTLNKFFFHWKMFSVNANQNIDLILRVSKGVTSLFFHKVKKRIFLNDTENNIKLIQARTIYKSLQQSINKKKNKNVAKNKIVEKIFNKKVENLDSKNSNKKYFKYNSRKLKRS